MPPGPNVEPPHHCSGAGSVACRRHLLSMSMKTTWRYLLQFSFKLFLWAQLLVDGDHFGFITCWNKYVSFANLRSEFPGVVAARSPVVATYAAGPMLILR